MPGHKPEVNSSPESADDGSVKGFFRQVVARGRAQAGTRPGAEIIRKLLAPVHPGNLLEGAAEVGGNPVVRTLLDLGLRTIRENSPGPAEFASHIRDVGERCHVFLPHLSPAARRDMRAVCFLTAGVLEKVSAESLRAAIDGWLEGTATPPTAIKEIVGLMTVVGLMGLLRAGDPDTADRAALELWRLVRAGEDEQAVEDAWDAAVLAESELEAAGPRIPFIPISAVG